MMPRSHYMRECVCEGSGYNVSWCNPWAVFVLHWLKSTILRILFLVISHTDLISDHLNPWSCALQRCGEPLVVSITSSLQKLCFTMAKHTGSFNYLRFLRVGAGKLEAYRDGWWHKDFHSST